MAKPFPEEVASFILNNPDMSAKDIQDHLKGQFDFDVSIEGIRTYRSKHGVRKYSPWTKEQDNWILENWCKFNNSKEMAAAFNGKFELNRTYYAVKNRLKRLYPYSKFPHSGGRPKGEGSSTTSLPVGHEIFRGGYWWVKVADNPLPKDYTSEQRYSNWKQKHRKIWEDNFGPIPDNHKVIFLDGNRHNFDLENLACPSKAVLAYMARNKLFFQNAATTLCSVRLGELKSLLKHPFTVDSTEPVTGTLSPGKLGGTKG